MPCSNMMQALTDIARDFTGTMSNDEGRHLMALEHACTCKGCGDYYVVTHSRLAKPSNWMSRHIV